MPRGALATLFGSLQWRVDGPLPVSLWSLRISEWHGKRLRMWRGKSSSLPWVLGSATTQPWVPFGWTGPGACEKAMRFAVNPDGRFMRVLGGLLSQKGQKIQAPARKAVDGEASIVGSLSFWQPLPWRWGERSFG